MLILHLFWLHCTFTAKHFLVHHDAEDCLHASSCRAIPPEGVCHYYHFYRFTIFSITKATFMRLRSKWKFRIYYNCLLATGDLGELEA